MPSSNPEILVVGDLMIDRYLWGKCNRISPEAPVPIVDIERETFHAGGAGNVFHNLIAFGARVHMASVVGDDAAAEDMRSLLRNDSANLDGVLTQHDRQTSKKTRIIAAHQQMLRIDRESRDPIHPQIEKAILSHIDQLLKKIDLVILSDYGKGLLTDAVCQGIIERANRLTIPVLVDPKGHDYTKYAGAYLITPNRREAGEATGMTLETLDQVKKAGESLRSRLKLQYAIITLSEEGMAIIGDEIHHIPTRAREVFDVTGAGDTVIAALGFSLAQGHSIEEASRFANEAAAVVVGKIGASTATLEEIARYEEQNRL